MTNNRKGIILAGGTGTRLYPLTQAANKQLLPVYDKPMVYYPISCIMLAGITEILIISSPDMLPAYKKVLGTGEQFGVSFEYVEQKEPRGLSEAYILAEEFLKGCPSLMILGDNLFYGSGMTEHLKSSSKSEACTIFAYYVDNPSAYGVVSFDKEFNVTNIEEKPKNPQSHYAITGMYFFNEQASEYAKSIKPSARGELEITELQNIYLEEKKLQVKLLGRGTAWLDTGTHESLLEASNFVHTIEKRQGLKIACLEEIGLNNGWLSKELLIDNVDTMGKSSYKNYILDIIKNHLA